jgi:hypothetical protein
VNDRPLILASGRRGGRNCCARRASASTCRRPDVDETLQDGRSARGLRPPPRGGEGRPRSRRLTPGGWCWAPTRRWSWTARCSASRATRPTPRRCSARLSGRSHLVLTGVCLIRPGRRGAGRGRGHDGRFSGRCQRSRLPPTWIPASRWTRRRLRDSGRSGGFVSRLDGAFDNVVGLPLALIQGMCRARGIQVS